MLLAYLPNLPLQGAQVIALEQARILEPVKDSEEPNSARYGGNGVEACIVSADQLLELSDVIGGYVTDDADDDHESHGFTDSVRCTVVRQPLGTEASNVILVAKGATSLVVVVKAPMECGVVGIGTAEAVKHDISCRRRSQYHVRR